MFYISESELEKLPLLQGDNKGIHGKCYEYNDEVLKVFHSVNFSDTNMSNIKRNIISNLGIKVENVAFPTEIGMVEKNKFSYTMPYIDGILLFDIYKNIKNQNFDLSFDEISNCYHNTYKTVQNISDYCIKMDDLHNKNCKLISKKKLGIFDTDFFKKLHESENHAVVQNNIKVINNVFKAIILSIYNEASIENSFTDRINYDELFQIFIKVGFYSKTFIDDALEELSKKTKANSLKGLIISK